MPLTCVSEDVQLTKTSDVEKDAKIKMPFVLNGAPMTTRPQSLRNLSTYRIKNSSSFKQFYQLTDSDYVLDNLLSDNIIGADSNTTLRYESQTYTQKFIALHSGTTEPTEQGDIWGETGTAVSIFFTARNDDMFHIYIPVTLTEIASSEENKFLKAWLDSSYTLPTPFSVNRLLEFIGGDNNIRFRISNFCLKYNNLKKINHYTLCKFNNAHTLQYSGLTTTSAPTGNSVSSYRRTKFNDVLNFMLNGIIVDQKNRNLISDVEHIATSSSSSSAIRPIFYKVTKDQLFTQNFTDSFTSNSCATGIKGLQNIKCYPLDLASQVDDNGNIFIDQDKKPIQVKNIGKDNIASGESSGISAEQLALQQKENTDSITFWAVFGVIFGILIIIVIAVVYYIYRQRANAAALIASAAATTVASSLAAAPPVVVAPAAPAAAPS